MENHIKASVYDIIYPDPGQRKIPGDSTLLQITDVASD